MDRADKLRLSADTQNGYCFKQGLFVRLYEQSLYWFVNHIKPLKPMLERVKGGEPLVNSSTSQYVSEVHNSSTITVDKTGTVNTNVWNTSWSNTGLPGGYYWSGTEVTDRPGNSWVVNDYGGFVSVDFVDQSSDFHVVCVP